MINDHKLETQWIKRTIYTCNIFHLPRVHSSPRYRMTDTFSSHQEPDRHESIICSGLNEKMTNKPLSCSCQTQSHTWLYLNLNLLTVTNYWFLPAGVSPPGGCSMTLQHQLQWKQFYSELENGFLKNVERVLSETCQKLLLSYFLF